jgi:hypothetical protein
VGKEQPWLASPGRPHYFRFPAILRLLLLLDLLLLLLRPEKKKQQQ